MIGVVAQDDSLAQRENGKDMVPDANRPCTYSLLTHVTEGVVAMPFASRGFMYIGSLP